MRILKNKEIEINKWIDLFNSSKFSSPFQTYEYYEFFNLMEKQSSDVFAIEENNEYKSLMVIVIHKKEGLKGFFSRRGIVYGGPLIVNTGNNYLTNLIESIRDYYDRKLIYLEIRNYFNYSDFNYQFNKLGFKYTPWLNFQLETLDIESVKKAMSKSRFRQIKKAIKNGVSWEEARSEDDIKSFYLILNNLYKTKVKKPLFPLDFFIEYYKKNLGKYLLVYYNDKVIGGIMCSIIKNRAIYEFYVCGLDHEYRGQYPSVMATWAGIEYGIIHGIPLFDFMGAGNPNEDYGVREFKSRFGGQQVENGRFKIIFKPLLYKIGVLGLNILTKLKMKTKL